MKRSILKTVLCFFLGVIFLVTNLYSCTAKDTVRTVKDPSDTITEKSYVKDVFDKSGNKIMEVEVIYLGNSADPDFPAPLNPDAMKYDPDFYHTCFTSLVEESELENRDIVFDSLGISMKAGTKLWKLNSSTKEQIANSITTEDGKGTYTIKPEQTVFLRNASIGFKGSAKLNREYTIIYKGEKIKFNVPLMYGE